MVEIDQLMDPLRVQTQRGDQFGDPIPNPVGPIGHEQDLVGLLDAQRLQVVPNQPKQRIRPLERAIDQRGKTLFQLPPCVHHIDDQKLRFTPSSFVAGASFLRLGTPLVLSQAHPTPIRAHHHPTPGHLCVFAQRKLSHSLHRTRPLGIAIGQFPQHLHIHLHALLQKDLAHLVERAQQGRPGTHRRRQSRGATLMNAQQHQRCIHAFMPFPTPAMTSATVVPNSDSNPKTADRTNPYDLISLASQTSRPRPDQLLLFGLLLG